MAPQAPYGLLGRTLGHSWSPQIHSRLGSVPYTLREVEPDDVEAFVRSGDWHGLNVTIPYKQRAYELADAHSPQAQRLGVANTLVRRPDGTIYADNTDVCGFGWMLDRFCRRVWGEGLSALAGQPVIVLGSGGASQAVQATLAEAGAHTSIISRAGDDNYENLVELHADAVLLVNTTPVGMYPRCPASPLTDGDFAALSCLRGVVDVVYNPLRTGICLQAERRGIPYESGLGMLVAQARFSSEEFLGCNHDDSLVEEIEGALRAQVANVSLIGMPGVGKTSTAAALARLLGRPFIDIDDAFRLAEGMSAASFITDRGEAAFRDAETRVLASYASRSGLVIACGGGVVVRPENYDLLHQNGAIVMLDRTLDGLSVSGRPLSQANGVERLAKERMPLYRSWADVIITCTGTPSGDARAIRGALGL